MDVELIAKEVVSLAHGEDSNEGAFLLARLITAQLLERPVETSDPGWRAQLAHTVEDALERDLSQGDPLKKNDEELPQAGRELLTALAYSYGSGFPTDDVWPKVATALSPTGVHYTRQDVFWALKEHGRYITASGQSGQAVYRLHERLASSLRADLKVEGGEPEARRVVAEAVLSSYESFLELGNAATEHAYLWLFAWRHAADAGAAGIEGLHQLVLRDAALTPDLGMALNTLAVQLSEAGIAGEAVVAAEQAVAIYEKMVEVSPGYTDDLADALSNLGVYYSQFGMRTEAVEPSEKALELYEEIAAENTAYRRDVAGSLSNLGIRYGEVGRMDDAVEPSERAVELYATLSEEDAGFRRDLGNALNNLGIRYSAVGRNQEAVPPTEKAVKLLEEVAAENPPFTGDLAAALSNLGAVYTEVGREREGLEPTEQAVEIYEELVPANPAYLGDLAAALNNLGNRYSALGRFNEGVECAERAVKIRSELAEKNPAFLGELAGSLNNLGNRYLEIGKREEAVERAEQAVETYERLARNNPAYLNDLAMALNNLGNRYMLVDKETKAVPTAERSVAIRKKLVETNPGIRGDLADSLGSLGGILLRRQLPEMALEPTLKAVEIYEELILENPVYLRDFSVTLNSLGTIYSETDEPERALPPVKRAVEVRERLAKDNPLHLGDLATGLNNLGNRLIALDRREEALGAYTRAVEIYEGLQEEGQTPPQNLAAALANLADCYDAEGALPFLERAVDIQEELTSEDPSFASGLADSLNRLLVIGEKAEKGDEAKKRWDAALEKFGEVDRAALVLRLRRLRSEEEKQQAFDDLIEASRMTAAAKGEIVLELHEVCRSVRAGDPEAFDERWQETLGDLPRWLQLDRAVMSTCVEWLSRESWADSRDFLTEHDLLLSDEGFLALDEYRLLDVEETLGIHRKILEESHEEGIESAYKPLLLGEVIRAWIEVRDPEESKEFLLAHRERLLDPEAALAASQLGAPIRASIIQLALDGDEGLDFAYKLLRNAEGHEQALAEAREKGDFSKLRAVAVLCGAGPSDAAEEASARTHLALALAAEGELDAAERAIQSIQDLAESRLALINIVTEAIGDHPDHAKAFAALIQILSSAGPSEP